jgi:amino acid transporter
VTHPPSIPPADPSETTSDIARRDSQQLRHGRLGVFAVAFFVISAAAPLTAMAGGAPVAMLLGNGPGIPLAYVVVSVILLIFSVGYTAMARHHTSTGAFYSFVSSGLRQPAGGGRCDDRPARLQRHADWPVWLVRRGCSWILQ